MDIQKLMEKWNKATRAFVVWKIISWLPASVAMRFLDKALPGWVVYAKFAKQHEDRKK